MTTSAFQALVNRAIDGEQLTCMWCGRRQAITQVKFWDLKPMCRATAQCRPSEVRVIEGAG